MNKIFIIVIVLFFITNINAEDNINKNPSTPTNATQSVEDILNNLDNKPATSGNSSGNTKQPQNQQDQSQKNQKQINENKFKVQTKFTEDPEPTKHLSVEVLYGNYLGTNVSDNISKNKSSFGSAVGAGVNFAVNLYPILRLGLEASVLKPYSNFNTITSFGYGYNKLNVNFLTTINSYFYGELDLYRSKKFNIYALAGVGYSATVLKIKEEVYLPNRIFYDDNFMKYLAPQEMVTLLKSLEDREQVVVMNNYNLSQEDYDEIQKNNFANFCDAADFKSDCLGQSGAINVVASCNTKDKDPEIAQKCWDEINFKQDIAINAAKDKFLIDNPNFKPNEPINYNKGLSELDTNYLSAYSFASGIVGDAFICSASLTPSYLNNTEGVRDNFGLVLGHSRYNVLKTIWVNDLGEEVPAPANGTTNNPYSFPKTVNVFERNEAYDKDIGYFVQNQYVIGKDKDGKDAYNFLINIIDYQKGIKQKYENGVLSCAYNFKAVYIDATQHIQALQDDAKQFRSCSASTESNASLPSAQQSQTVACEKSANLKRNIKDIIKGLLGVDNIANAIDTSNFSDAIFSAKNTAASEYRLIDSKSSNAVFSYVSYKVGFGANFAINKNFSYYIKANYHFNAPVDRWNVAKLNKNEITKINNYIKVSTSFASVVLGVSYNWY